MRRESIDLEWKIINNKKNGEYEKGKEGHENINKTGKKYDREERDKLEKKRNVNYRKKRN